MLWALWLRWVRAGRLLRLGALLAPLALGAGCTGPGGEDAEGGGDEAAQEERRAPTDPRTLVELHTLALGEVADQLVANGAVESEAQADLVPEVSGQVVSILAEEGDRVRRGQVLAVIENASLLSGLEQAVTNLNSAKAELDRVEALHRAGAVSEAELSTARANHTLAQLRQEEARTLRSRTQLVSPIDGTVSIRDLQYGEVAGGGRAFQVVDLDRLVVVVKVPERDLPRLAVGQKATLTPVYDPDTQVQAEVVRLSPTVDATTGTVRATIAIPSGESRLRPGQYVGVRLELERRAEVLVVPRRAVVYEEGEPVVYLVKIEEPPPPEEDEADAQEPKDKGKAVFSFGSSSKEEAEPEPVVPGPYRVARRVPVTLGLSDEDHAEVTSGLSAGDTVIVTGQASLRDGARVRIPEDPPAHWPEPDPKAEDKAEDKADAGTEG